MNYSWAWLFFVFYERELKNSAALSIAEWNITSLKIAAAEREPMKEQFDFVHYRYQQKNNDSGLYTSLVVVMKQ